MSISVVRSREFKYGTIDTIEPQSIPRGAVSRSLNWLTFGSHMELRRGHAYLGTSSVTTGSGKISSLRKVVTALGVDKLFGTHGKKIMYFDRATSEWLETGSDVLGDLVVDDAGIAKEPVSLEPYTSPAGNQLWAVSMSCVGLFKIMIANPETALDQYLASKNFKGLIKIDTNRMLLWLQTLIASTSRKTMDQTGVYGSYIDNQAYSTTSGDTFGTKLGDGVVKTFTGYLSFKTRASSTLTSDTTNVSNGDTVTVGGQTYTFVTSLTPVANEVLIGGSAAASLLNLKFAINQDTAGTSGINYAAATAQNANVYVTSSTATTLVVKARVPGTSGNAIVTSETSAHLSWTGGTFSGGVADRYSSLGIAVSAICGGQNVVLSDDYDGNLSAPDGSTGTVNYATGLISVTFHTAPDVGEAVAASFQVEDSQNHGLADFTKSSPRTAGQGFVFRQDEGGGAMRAIGQFDNLYYCFHVKKTWILDIGLDDTTATNLPYLELVGISSSRGFLETGRGIYYIDEVNGQDKRVRLLTYEIRGADKVIPISVSDNLNLNDYIFGESAGFEFGDFVLWACATKDSTTEIDGLEVPANNRTIVYNKIWKSWDVLDYAVTCLDTYDDALVAGASTSNNFLELFSGLVDPDDTLIANFVEFDLDDLDIEGLKKTKRLHVQGGIGPSQKLKYSIAYDRGSFVEIGGEDVDDGNGNITHVYAVEGTGSYVDKSERVAVGPNTLGKHELGGGSDGIEAYNYERLIPIRGDKFEHAMIRVEAMDVGYASVSQKDWYDVRGKGRRVPRKYRT